jgi:hypothetical protein
VIDAVREGRLHIWSVNTIDEGIEALTGKKAGQKDANGVFEDGSVNSLVDSQLRSYLEMWMNYTGGNNGKHV